MSGTGLGWVCVMQRACFLRSSSWAEIVSPMRQQLPSSSLPPQLEAKIDCFIFFQVFGSCKVALQLVGLQSHFRFSMEKLLGLSHFPTHTKVVGSAPGSS